MRFKEGFEPILMLTNNVQISGGIYETYDEAKDKAIAMAAASLPDETVKAFQVLKVYINLSHEDAPEFQKGGDYQTYFDG